MKKRKTNPWIIVLIVAASLIGLLMILSVLAFFAILFYITPTTTDQTPTHGNIPIDEEVVRVIREDLSTQELLACRPSQRNADVCTSEHSPVCGYRNFPENCDAEVCQETFSNSCNACSNTEILYYTPGPCTAEQ